MLFRIPLSFVGTKIFFKLSPIKNPTSLISINDEMISLMSTKTYFLIEME